MSARGLGLAVLLASLAACGRPSVNADVHASFARVELALEEGKLSHAWEELQALASEAEPALQRQRLFWEGNLAFARAEARLARAQAALGKAEDWQEALRQARAAQRLWRDARGARRDWPAARRNAERVERWIWQVLELAEQAGVDPGDAAQPSQATDQVPPPESTEPPPDAPAVPPPPTPERLDALLERLEEQQDRARSERRALPGLDAPEVERDW